jgi:hypothetical protein
VAKTNSLARAGAVKGGASAGVSTNDALASAPQVSPGMPLEDPDEEKPAAVDAPLLEAQQIMLDYLSVAAKANFVTAGKVE